MPNGPDDANLAIVGIRNSAAPFLADDFVSPPPPGPIDPARWSTQDTVYVEEPFLEFGVTTAGVKTTGSSGNAILTQYLQDFYASNPGYAGGSYLFLRVNPTASDGFSNGNRWELYSADAHSQGFPNAVRPTLTLTLIDAPTLACVGFDPPMHQSPVTVRGKNRALPLKAELLDDQGSPMSDLDVVAPPVVQVLFDSGVGGGAVDVTDGVLPVGQGDDGNQFTWSDGRWRFNFKTSNFSAPGSYFILMDSGDESEYLIDPTCQVEFVIP